jgi:hypothetical protein
MTQKNLDLRCKALAKSGKPCRAAATPGGLCFFHANPKKASELGRIGGRRKSFPDGGSADSLLKLETAAAVRDVVTRLIADVFAGKMNPKIAAGLAPLLNLQLRAIETTDLERRLAEVEKRSADTAEVESKPGIEKANLSDEFPVTVEPEAIEPDAWPESVEKTPSMP